MMHWLELAKWALICLWQELRGQEPDCPDCWKCEMLRVVFACIGAGGTTWAIKYLLTS